MANLLFIFCIPVVFDPQSWYGDSELEIGSELPASFHKGYRSVIPKPPDFENRQMVYDFMVSLVYCSCLTAEEFETSKNKAVKLSKQICALRV